MLEIRRLRVREGEKESTAAWAPRFLHDCTLACWGSFGKDVSKICGVLATGKQV